MIYQLLIFLLLFGEVVGQLLNGQNETQLNSWEFRVLRDFVRGKGHGSVSRLSLQDALSPPNLFEEESPLLDLNDPNLVNMEGIYNDRKKPQVQSPQQSLRGFSQIIMPTSIIAPASYLSTLKKPAISLKPSSRPEVVERPVPIVVPTQKTSVRKEKMKVNAPTPSAVIEISEQFPQKPKKPKVKKLKAKSDSEPSMESFQELAGLFQQFINRRKNKPSSKPMIEEPSSEKVPAATKLTQSTSAIGKWESMDPNDTDVDEEEQMPLAKEAWEEKMKQLSEQLTQVLKQIKKDSTSPTKVTIEPKKETKLRLYPIVTVLRNGSAEQSPEGSYTFSATITLIQADGKNILVDTGLGTDINGRTLILNKLSALGIAPPNIDIVVTTHGHPDHSGGIHDFPDAEHYQGWYQHRGTSFNLSALFENDKLQLTPHVHLMRTPGHTSDDISVVVRDEQVYGTLTISGDIFIRKEDIDYPMMWQPLSANEAQQAESRRRLICSDSLWIIPGHGPPFRVTSSIRSRFKC